MPVAGITSRLLAIGVVAVQVALAIAGACFISRFLASTTQSLDPPPGTQAYTANSAFKHYLPSQATVSYFNVFVTYNGDWPDASPDHDIVNVPTLSPFLSAISEGLHADPTTSAILGEMGDFYLLNATQMFRIADHLVSKDGRSVTSPITCDDTRFSKRTDEFGRALTSILHSVEPILRNGTALQLAGFPRGAESQFTVGANGLPLFLDSIVRTSKKDMVVMDAVVLPLAIVIIALRLRSVRLMVPAVFALGGSFCTSFGLMYAFTSAMPITSSAPLVMMALDVALSLSYTLFFLGRFAEELRREAHGTELSLVTGDEGCVVPVLWRVVRTSGFACTVSMVVLALALATLTLFPVGILKGIGVACVVSVITSWLYGTVAVAAIMFIAPTFWAKGIASGMLLDCIRGGGDASLVMDVQDVDGKTRDTESDDDAMSMVDPDGTTNTLILQVRHSASCLSGKLMHRLLHHCIACAGILLICVGIGIALSVEAAKLKTSDNYIDYLGRHAAMTRDYEAFVAHYGYGFTEPFRILFALEDDAPANATLFKPEYWDAGQERLRRIVNDPLLGNQTHLAGPMVIGDSFQTLHDIEWCWLECNDKSIYAFVLSQVAPNRRSMFTILTAKFDPAGAKGWDLYTRLLSTLRRPSDRGLPGLKVYVEGMAPDELDTVHRIFEDFPALAAGSTAVVFVLVAVALRAPICALRCAFVAGLSEAIVFGCTVGVYQNDGLEWTMWAALQPMGSIPFIMPCVAFAVTLGLAVAFDVFVAARFAETMVSRPLSITRAWTAAVPDVLVAGLISVVAMFGLMLSQVPLMNAMGFAFVLAAAVPSLLGQCLVTPCFTVIAGSAMWWPRAHIDRAMDRCRGIQQQQPADHHYQVPDDPDEQYY